MVRVNLIDPRNLADQHLIAEYNEMLMLVAYVRKYPKVEGVPDNFTLGKGHMIFFKDKLRYLEKRHKLIREEMKRRGFRTNKKLLINGFDKKNRKDWKPNVKDLEIIRKRLIEKIKLKPGGYKYHGENRGEMFFVGLIKS